MNKAGYTANTSRGRVGRGGNACFPTFRLDHHGPTNRPTDQRTDGRTDKASYRVACPRLKSISEIRWTDRSIDQQTNVELHACMQHATKEMISCLSKTVIFGPCWAIFGVFRGPRWHPLLIFEPSFHFKTLTE